MQFFFFNLFFWNSYVHHMPVKLYLEHVATYLLRHCYLEPIEFYETFNDAVLKMRV